MHWYRTGACTYIPRLEASGLDACIKYASRARQRACVCAHVAGARECPLSGWAWLHLRCLLRRYPEMYMIGRGAPFARLPDAAALKCADGEVRLGLALVCIATRGASLSSALIRITLRFRASLRRCRKSATRTPYSWSARQRWQNRIPPVSPFSWSTRPGATIARRYSEYFRHAPNGRIFWHPRRRRLSACHATDEQRCTMQKTTQRAPHKANMQHATEDIVEMLSLRQQRLATCNVQDPAMRTCSEQRAIPWQRGSLTACKHNDNVRPYPRALAPSHQLE